MENNDTYNGYAGNLRFSLFGDPDYIDPKVAKEMLKHVYPALKTSSVPKGKVLIVGTADENETGIANFEELWKTGTQ